MGPDGSLYIADTENHRIRRVTPQGIMTTVAGNGERGFSGDGGPALAASLVTPGGVAVGPDGSVFISDSGNDRVRKVDPLGIISTLAGGDGGPATEAGLNNPTGLAVAPDGSLYIADRFNSSIRKVSSGPAPQPPQLRADPPVVVDGDRFTLVLAAELPNGTDSVISDTVLINGSDSGVSLLPLLTFDAEGVSGRVELPGFAFSAADDALFTWVVETSQGSDAVTLCVNVGGGVRCP